MGSVEPNMVTPQNEVSLGAQTTAGGVDGDVKSPEFVYVRALYNYFPIGKEELAIEQSDIFLASDTPVRNGWALGVKGGQWGWYPAEYVTKLTDKELEEFKRKEVEAALVQRQLLDVNYTDNQRSAAIQQRSTTVMSSDTRTDNRSSLLRGWINKYATVLSRKKRNEIRNDPFGKIGFSEFIQEPPAIPDGVESFATEVATATSYSAKSSIASSSQEGKVSQKKSSDRESDHLSIKSSPKRHGHLRNNYKKESWLGIVSSLKTLQHRLFTKGGAIKFAHTNSTSRRRKIQLKNAALASTISLNVNSVPRLDQSVLSSDEDTARSTDIQGNYNSKVCNSTNDTSINTSTPKINNDSNNLDYGHDGSIENKLDENLEASLSNRNRAIYELISTERNFVRDLDVIIDIYMLPIKMARLLQSKDIEIVFSNIESMRRVNKTLLYSLECKVSPQTGEPSGTIGDIFLSLADFFKMYTMYCSNLPYAFIKLRSFRESESVTKFINYCSTLSDSKGFTLTMFMIRPAQRICKYPALLEKILKYTPEDHEDYKSLKKAKEKIETVVAIVDEASRNAYNMIKMCDLQEKFSNKINIVSPNRILLMSGIFRVSIQKLSDISSSPNVGENRGIYLFNDMILIAKLSRETDKKLKYLKRLSFNNLVIRSCQNTQGSLRLFKDSYMCYSIHFNDKKTKDTWVEHIIEAKRALRETKIMESQSNLSSADFSPPAVDETSKIVPISDISLDQHPDKQEELESSNYNTVPPVTPAGAHLSVDNTEEVNSSPKDIASSLPITNADTKEMDGSTNNAITNIALDTENISNNAIEAVPPIYEEYCNKEVLSFNGTTGTCNNENLDCDDSQNFVVKYNSLEGINSSSPEDHEVAFTEYKPPSLHPCDVTATHHVEPHKKPNDHYSPDTPTSCDPLIGFPSREYVEKDKQVNYLDGSMFPPDTSDNLGIPDAAATLTQNESILSLPSGSTQNQLKTSESNNTSGATLAKKLPVASINFDNENRRISDSSMSNTDDTINEPAMKYVGFTLLGEDFGTELKFCARRRSISTSIIKCKFAPKPPRPLKHVYIDESSILPHDSHGFVSTNEGFGGSTLDGICTLNSSNLLQKASHAPSHEKANKQDLSITKNSDSSKPCDNSDNIRIHPSRKEENLESNTNTEHKGNTDLSQTWRNCTSTGSRSYEGLDPAMSSSALHNTDPIDYLLGLTVSDIETDDNAFECIRRPVKNAVVTNVYIADNAVIKYIRTLSSGDKKGGDKMSLFIGNSSGVKYLYSINVGYIYKAGNTIYSTIYRTYEDFFDLHLNIVGNFTAEAGLRPSLRKLYHENNKNSVPSVFSSEKSTTRIIPYLPCQMMVVTSETAVRRISLLQTYINQLLSLPPYMSRSPHVLSFFKPVKIKIKTKN